jgi:hypothetical protein
MKALKRGCARVLCVAGDPALRQGAYRVFVALLMTMMVCQHAAPALAQDGGGVGGLAGLVKKAVNGLVILTGLSLAFGIAFTGFSATLAKWAGAPNAEATAILRIISLVLLFILVVFAIPLSNAVIDAIFENYQQEDIRIPPV